MTATTWVLGARGFIGRYLVRRLVSAGREVSGLGHGAWPQHDAAACGVQDWLNGEVSGPNLDLLAEHSGQPECIYHLAGGSSVAVAQQAPLEDFERTVATTARLLEWVRTRAPQARVVLSSSAAVYGIQERQPILETAETKPTSCYGYHKRAAEFLCESYNSNFKLSVAIVRLFSVYGAGLRKQIFWDLCSRLERGEAILLGGTGEETRDFIHVEDAVNCLVTVGNRQEQLLLNGASGVARTVREVAESVIAAWGSPIRVAFDGRPRIGDPSHLRADVSMLHSLNFQPTWNWQAGVQAYVDWFKSEARGQA